MNVLSVSNVSKSVKDENLFSQVSFGLEESEKLGLIGKNGAGKSTFLKLIAGSLEPDEGTISKNSKCRLSFLEQNVLFHQGCTLKDFLFLLNDSEIDILKRYNNGDNSLSDVVESRHLWDIETRYERFLEELGVKKSLTSAMDNLSGGEQKKAAIARILSVKPDILLLDEPTNHLDIEAIEWLENYLKSALFTVILVTHDRYFLDSICTKIMEFDNHKAFFYEGGYTNFLERREERISAQLKEQDRLSNILRREIEWLHRGPKARTGKDSSRKNRIEQMKNLQTHEEEQSRDFSSISRRLGKKILELKNITVSRSDKVLLKSFSFEFVKGMRIGVIGPNGSGKSTLMDVITGALQVDSGLVDIGINTVFGYYDQKSLGLPLNKTPLEFFSDIAESIVVSKDYVVTPARFLELFGFPSSFHRLEIRTFSGGEKRRLYLLSQLVKNPNFLVLDEPTNDLDIDTMRSLEQYVIDFSGVVIVVSHDRAFLDRTCDELIIMPEAKRFEGSYSAYKASCNEKTVREVSTTVNTKQVNREKKGLSFKEKKELEALEESIALLEEEKKNLEDFFSSGEIDSDGSRQKRYKEINETLELSYDRWTVLSDLL